jgi:GTPase
MQFRIAEGLGEAKYEIGVSDDGVPIGISETQLQQVSIWLSLSMKFVQL